MHTRVRDLLLTLDVDPALEPHIAFRGNIFVFPLDSHLG